MRAKRKLVAFVLICFLLGGSLSVRAEVTEADKAKIQEKQVELQEIQGQMGQKQQNVEQTRKKARAAHEQLREVESSLAVAEKELSELETKLSDVVTQMTKNEEALAKAEADLKERGEAYAKRVRNIYMHGQMNYLDVLLGARDFSDFNTRMELLLRIVKNDTQLITKIRSDQALVKAQQEKLASDKAEIGKLRNESAAKKEVIASQRQQRKVVFEQAAAERNQAEREYNDLRATSQRITDMIRRMEAGGQIIGQGTGAMVWPLRGEITSPFGWRTHPIFGTQKYHSGLDIGGDYGDPIKAADEGVVISSGWLGGYGYCVIIDHGNGVTTLYGHNSELWVGVGDRVGKGQTIALCGSTGYSTGPHCHFEVREHGETVNPLNYLP